MQVEEIRKKSIDAALEDFSIENIKPLHLPSVTEHAQTEAVPSVIDEVPPTNVVEQQPSIPPIQRRVSSKQRITVKMATEEYYAMKLKAKNAGVSASEIVRMAIRDCHIRARLTIEQADYIRKLCGMANNLNQLTRKAHREGVRLHYGQCQHLLLSLENIMDHISL